MTTNEVMDILIFSKISKPNNFEALSKEEWKWLITEIKKDFGTTITQGELLKIITNGVKGYYDKTQFALNGFTIYKWIRIFLQTKPKIKLPCPASIESFYWEQMSEIDQQKWLNTQPKQIDEPKNK